jgi:zinc transporter ZupT
MKLLLHIRNTGQIDTSVSQADINDRIHPAAIEPKKDIKRFESAKIIIPFSWNRAEPYEIGITTDDGTRFSKLVDAAAPTIAPNYEQLSIFAIIGTYVGIIPIMVGLLWYPFIRKLSHNIYNFFLSFTAGLLVFLGIDALLESNEIIVTNVSSIFNGQMLIIIITIITFLGLNLVTKKLTRRRSKEKQQPLEQQEKYHSSKSSSSSLSSVSSTSSGPSQSEIIKPLTLSMMIAIGIGLHNFGEGLAIGSTILIGEIALSTFLIIGFTIHNTTEGLAIISPLKQSQKKISIRSLVILGLIAGGPTILGTWIGGFLYYPIATAIFIAIGAGAIFQVVHQIYSWFSSYSEGKNVFNDGYIISGFLVGMIAMYLTGLLV